MLFFDKTPVVRIRTTDPWQYRLGRWLVRWLWSLRVEATLAALTVVVGRLLALTAGQTVALFAAAALGLAVLCWPPVVTRLDRALERSDVRRRWESACRHAGLVNRADRVPSARVAVSPVGHRLAIRVPAGLSVPEVDARAEVLAAVLELREVRVHRDPANARKGTVTLLRVDPFDTATPILSALANPDRVVSLWEPFAVATDEDGDPVTLHLPERNVLLGGEPGAGKSAAVSLPLAAAALDPDVDVTLLDGKQVEFAVWRPIATETVGPNVDHANRILARLVADMDRRYAWLLERGRRKVHRGDGLRLQVVAIDELAFFLHMGDRNQTKQFTTLLWDLVARGRAAGIIVLAATQKPAADVVPSKLRDLFGFRWALRCATRDASDTILGAGWASLGYSAATVPGEQRGVGYLLSEGALPVRCRAHYLDDTALTAIAQRAARLRADHLDAQMTDPRPEDAH